MKMMVVVLLVCTMLCGCAAVETMETVADEWVIPVAAKPRETTLELPGEALACAMESDTGRMYFGDSYEISLQTRPAGDLNATLEEITGFSRDDLTVMQTEAGGITRSEFVWASAGESGDRVGRGVILDDGEYHYCLSVLQDAEVTDCQIVWGEVFHSFRLV